MALLVFLAFYGMSYYKGICDHDPTGRGTLFWTLFVVIFLYFLSTFWVLFGYVVHTNLYNFTA